MSVDLLSKSDGGTPEQFERSDLNHKLTCINHVSRETCDAFGRQNVQQFIDKFELNSYHSYMYCPHPLVRSLLSTGWFPLHLLPGCPKLDRYL